MKKQLWHAVIYFFLNIYFFLERLTSNTIKNKSIHLNSWHPNHKKQKNSLKTQIVLLILKYLEWPYKEYIKTTKNGSFCEESLSKNDFGTVSANFCFYDYGANTSEAVPKISARTLELYAI